jgi:hypothetical protein
MSCYKLYSFGVVEKVFPTHKVVSILLYDENKVYVKPLYIEDSNNFKTMVFSPIVKLLELNHFNEKRFTELVFNRNYKIVKSDFVLPTIREYVKVIPMFNNIKYLNNSFEKLLLSC